MSANVRAFLIGGSRSSHRAHLRSFSFTLETYEGNTQVRTMNLLKTKLAGMLVVALCVSLAAPALAGAQQSDPTADQYCDQVSQVDVGSGGDGSVGGVNENCRPDPGAIGGSSPSSSAGLSGRVGPLPFTGFDVIAMAAVALAVTGLGLALQRAVSRRPTDGLS
jgi:hypothetical protein